MVAAARRGAMEPPLAAHRHRDRHCADDAPVALAHLFARTRRAERAAGAGDVRALRRPGERPLAPGRRDRARRPAPAATALARPRFAACAGAGSRTTTAVA